MDVKPYRTIETDNREDWLKLLDKHRRDGKPAPAVLA